MAHYSYVKQAMLTKYGIEGHTESLTEAGHACELEMIIVSHTQ